MADRGSGNPQDHQSSRELLYRLLVFIVFVILFGCAFVILFGCGQLALSNVAYQAAPDTRSKMQADYRTWPVVLIPAINPAIIEDIRREENLNPTVIAGPFWPTTDRPTAIPQPTLIAQQPTATPAPPTATPTFISTPTATPSRTLQPTRTATPYPTRIVWPTVTSTPWPTATETPWPTGTPRPPQPDPPTHTPTNTLTPSLTPTLAPSFTPTPTVTPSATSTPTPTPTQTVAPTPTETATPTSTATSTPTPTGTPPCPGNIPPGEPNLGLPNGSVALIQCGGYIDIDLGGQRITSHPGYDFVDYELVSGACGGICLDWVQIDVCDAACSSWVTVFNWGDGAPDNNTNVGGFGADGEDDNEAIPAGALLNGSGITIDVDAIGPVPPSGYRYIRIWSPINWPNNDGAEVDSIEIVP